MLEILIFFLPLQVIDETLRHISNFSAFRKAATDVNINGFLKSPPLYFLLFSVIRRE